MNFKTILAISFTFLSVIQSAQAKQPHSFLGTEKFAYYGKAGVVTASAPGFKLNELPEGNSEKAHAMYKFSKNLFEKTEKSLGTSADCTTIFISYSDRETTSPVTKANALRKYKEGLLIEIRQQCPNQDLKSLDLTYGVIETEKDQCTITSSINRIKTEIEGVCDLHEHLTDAGVKKSLESTINTKLGIKKS